MIRIPESVQKIMRRMEDAGFEIYAVGGCVRDSLLGRTPLDWDLTTNALPEQVVSCFFDTRVIKTGIRHGTVTVLSDGMPVEITTYRRDGAYEDNRHPSAVTFTPSLPEDLARRDFTVNALAYHPDRGIVDRFGGLDDLKNQVITCVGDAGTRFYEDGLRILRAVRFASVLGFSIAPETAEQIHACRHLLQNIARERIRVEFDKLLCGKNAVPILREFSGVISEFLPELIPSFGFAQNTRYHCFDVWEHTLHALEVSPPDLITRLTLLFHDTGKPASYSEDRFGGHFKGHADVSEKLADEAMRRLRYDNAAREAVCHLVRDHDRPLFSEEKKVRRLLMQYTEEELFRLLEVHRCDRLAHAPEFCAPPPAIAEIPDVVRKIRASDACFSLRTLAVNGNDLAKAGIPAGKPMGEILHLLLEKVVDEELPNEKEALILFAQTFYQNSKEDS